MLTVFSGGAGTSQDGQANDSERTHGASKSASTSERSEKAGKYCR